MDRIISIIAGTAVLSGGLILFGWFSLPVRVMVLVVLVGVCVCIFRRMAGFYTLPLERECVKPSPTSYLAIIALTIAALMVLSSSAATDPIRSPWSVVPSAFFTLYALLVGVTALLTFRGSRAAALGIACAIAVGSAVALLVYPIGFGFDHFIHTAAERIVVDTGALTPRPFFYSAHYGLVALIAMLGVPVAIADRILAPLLTVLLLVPLAVRTLGPRGALALLLIPFLPLVVSTPQATANVFALTAALLVIAKESATEAIPVIPGLPRPCRRVLAMTLCCAAAFLSNPLTGIPLIGTVAATLFTRAHHRTLAVFSAVSGIIGIPLALLIATRVNSALNLHIGFSFDPVRAAVASIRDALTFSAADFATADALALARVVLPVAWIVFAMIGAWSDLSPSRWEGEIKRGWHATASLISTTIALASAALVSLTTTLSSQLPEEQSQLPLRLLSLAAILSVPLVGRAVSQISNLKFQITGAAVALVLAALATFTLLLSYPRDDAQARSGLWSVSADDITAVHAIATDAGDERFVVLSNQMLAAAAIRELGFRPAHTIEEIRDGNEQSKIENRKSEILSFPLPAGGPLAQHFWSYLEHQNQCTQFWTAVQNCVTAREPIDAAMHLVGADRAYVVLHSYWRNYDRLATATAAIADAEVGNFQNLRIFRFTTPTP